MGYECLSTVLNLVSKSCYNGIEHKHVLLHFIAYTLVFHLLQDSSVCFKCQPNIDTSIAYVECNS